MLAVRPNEAELYYRAAALCVSANDHTAAIGILSQAEARFPDVWAVHYELGHAYSRRAATDLSENDRSLATSHMEKALRLCPSDAARQNIQLQLDKVKGLKIR